MWKGQQYRALAALEALGLEPQRAGGITRRAEAERRTAQHIANHESPRTTMLYDRRQEEISLDEEERIAI